MVEDWRDADPSTVERLFAREVARWEDTLGWDTRATWAIVDQGRRRGHVPGWILNGPDGEVRGWTFYILHDSDLQIGGLTADRATDVRLLLDRVLDSPEASLATTISAFVFPAPPSLRSALSRRRFAVRESRYLTRSLETPAAVLPAADGVRVRPFDERDVFPAARQLAASYEGVPGGECFAPRGRLDEWARYLRQLVDTPACGVWMPEASLVAESPDGARLEAVAIVTRLSPRTAHLAQIAVAPGARGRGLARQLLTEAFARARRAGCDVMSLMVDEENETAGRLYEREGFVPTSAFFHARRRGQVREVFTPGARRAG